MNIKFKSLGINLDNYQRNIQLVCKNKTNNKLLDLIISEWVSKGYLYRKLDKETKLIIENRQKYSSGDDQIPLLILVNDLLDISWLTKIQSKVQVQMIYCTEDDVELPNFAHKFYHDFNNIWSINGRFVQVSDYESVGAILC